MPLSNNCVMDVMTTKKMPKLESVPLEAFIAGKEFSGNYETLRKYVEQLENRYKNINVVKVHDYKKRLEQSIADAQNSETVIKKGTENIRNEVFALDEDQTELFQELQSKRSLLAAFDETLLENARKGLTFQSGRDEGAISKSTKHIRELVTGNPHFSSKMLEVKADKAIIGNMSSRRFANAVTEARIALDLPKPTKANRTTPPK